MIRLMQGPMGFMFVFGSGPIETRQPIHMEGEPTMFRTKREALEAAQRHGLKVDKKGFVSAINPSNMNGLEATSVFIGDVGDTLYAVKIEGVDPNFLTRPFGRQMEEWQRIREWQKNAKHDWFSAKARKGKNAKAELRRWIKMVNPREFFAKLNPNDDSHQIFYTL